MNTANFITAFSLPIMYAATKTMYFRFAFEIKSSPFVHSFQTWYGVLYIKEGGFLSTWSSSSNDLELLGHGIVM
jgi:hypothetical protein